MKYQNVDKNSVLCPCTTLAVTNYVFVNHTCSRACANTCAV